MSANRASVQTWLFRELTAGLAAAFETMTGGRPAVECKESEREEPAALHSAFQWRQPFSNLPGAIWVAAAEPDWTAAGGAVVQAAGMEEQDPARLKSEYLEILNQTFAGVAQAMAARLEREVVGQGGQESALGAGEAVWTRMHVRLADSSASLAVGLEPELVDALVTNAAPEIEAPPEKASTFDLLFDVELPVSVSFGRAQVALKDVLKLTTGSIVELNRAMGDPVEVIVNNCVIARGEVVVVGGNFGVRIQQVISRQERLRTLT